MKRVYEQGEKSIAIRLLKECRRVRHHPYYGYIIALSLGVVGMAIQWIARNHYAGAPFLTLYPSVVAGSLLGGTIPGFLIAGIAGAVQWVLFIPHIDVVAIASYALDATICVMLIDFINRSFDLLLFLLDEEKRSGRRHYLVSRELHHRIQNLFAVIQAVVRLSMPGNSEKCKTLRSALIDRFGAMAATNLLISEAHENGVSLSSLIETEVKVFTGRIHVTCIDGVMLGPQLAQNLSLILHELTTNALKHGSLSVPDGIVVLNVDWDRHRVIWLRWREVDGPLVNRPTESGFGSRLLDTFAKRMGSVRMDFSRTGFVYSLKIESDEIWLGQLLLMSKAA